jgi:hypothetical protein
MHDDELILIERLQRISGKTRNLCGALEKLNVNQRIVIDPVYFEGYSQTEMAAKRRQPLGTVTTWVRSALKILREELQESNADASRARCHIYPRPTNDNPLRASAQSINCLLAPRDQPSAMVRLVTSPVLFQAEEECRRSDIYVSSLH